MNTFDPFPAASTTWEYNFEIAVYSFCSCLKSSGTGIRSAFNSFSGSFISLACTMILLIFFLFYFPPRLLYFTMVHRQFRIKKGIDNNGFSSSSHSFCLLCAHVRTTLQEYRKGTNPSEQGNHDLKSQDMVSSVQVLPSSNRFAPLYPYTHQWQKTAFYVVMPQKHQLGKPPPQL